MSKFATAGLVAFCIIGASPAYAQVLPPAGPAQEQITEADLKAVTERRIDLVKVALQLTPAQQKYWPAVEAAIRARADARRARLMQIAGYAKGDRERSPLELLRDRADALTARGAALKKLVDAWQPLYESLDDVQRIRLRFLAAYVLREMRDLAESRRYQAMDDDGYYD
jgi:zinc resistance-associated protein